MTSRNAFDAVCLADLVSQVRTSPSNSLIFLMFHFGALNSLALALLCFSKLYTHIPMFRALLDNKGIVWANLR